MGLDVQRATANGPLQRHSPGGVRTTIAVSCVKMASTFLQATLQIYIETENGIFVITKPDAVKRF